MRIGAAHIRSSARQLDEIVLRLESEARRADAEHANDLKAEAAVKRAEAADLRRQAADLDAKADQFESGG